MAEETKKSSESLPPSGGGVGGVGGAGGTGAGGGTGGAAPPAKVDPEEEARKRELAKRKWEADIADEEKRLALARKAVREASQPAAETKALEGKLSIDDRVSIESEILAHQAVEAIAAEIARVLGPESRTYVVHQDNDLNAVVAYRAFEAQAAVIDSAYRELAAPPPAPPPAPGARPRAGLTLGVAAATTAVKSVLDLIALFRTDTEIKGKEFAVDEAVLVSELRARLPRSAKLYYPRLFPAAMLLSPDGGVDPLRSVLARLEDLRTNEAAAALAVSRLAGDAKVEGDRRLTEVRALHTQFEQALFNGGGGGSMLAGVPATPGATGAPPVASVVQGAALRELLQTEGRLLYLKVQRAGGSNRTDRNLFRGTKLSHSGAPS
jgi:hypothetical protein